MNKRNLSSTFYAPDKIVITNLDNNVQVECSVIEYGAKRITAAIQGQKIILDLNSRGFYEGNISGMNLRYNPKKL